MMSDLGRRVLGLSAIFLGICGLYYRDFANVQQPVPPEMPARTAAAILTAVLFLLAGCGLQWRRAIAPAASILIFLYLIFIGLWIHLVIGSPLVFGIWGFIADSFAPLLAAATLLIEYGRGSAASPRLLRYCTIGFGVCAVVFGCDHFFYMSFTAKMVPSWIPPDQWTWALLTGIAHVVGGIAIIFGLHALTAARLLTLMYGLFGLLVWVPRVLNDPGKPTSWTGIAVNISLVGAAWVIADVLKRLQVGRAVQQGETVVSANQALAGEQAC